MADGRLRRFDLLWVGAIFVTGQVMLGLILFGIYAIYRHLETAPATHLLASGTVDRLAIVASFLAMTAISLFGSLWLAHRRGISLQEIGFRRCESRWYFYSVGCLFVTLAAYVLLMKWVMSMGGVKSGTSLQIYETLAHSPSPLWAAIIIFTAGPIIAVGEETLFRGLLYRWFRQRSSILVAAPVSALLFGILHFHFLTIPGVAGLIVTAFPILLGIGTALVYEGSGSLWPPILLHAANNSLVIVVSQTMTSS